MLFHLQFSMAHLTFACLLCLLSMFEIGAAKSDRINSEINVHALPYWIQDSLFE
jgi:hypothetical protein